MKEFFFLVDDHFMSKTNFYTKRETEFGKQILGAALHLSLSTMPCLGVVPLIIGATPDFQNYTNRMRH